MNFHFPGTYAELRDNHFSGNYRVKSKNQVSHMDERLILMRLNQFEDGFNQLATLIEDPQYFDFLYYLVEHLDAHPNQKVQLQLVEILSFQIQKLYPDHAQAFKMTLFLLLNLLQQKQLQGQQVRRALKTLQQLFNLNAFHDFGREGSRYIFDLVKMAVEIKDAQIRELWIDVLVQAIAMWQTYDLNLKNRIVHLMYEQESVVLNISKFLLGCSKNDRLKQYTVDQIILLVNYITEKSTNQTESLAVKNLKELLSQTSKDMPKVYYQQLSAFIGLYDNENYHIRNGLSELITNVIEYLIKESKDQDSDEFQLTNANNLIKQLLDRHMDKTALCRSNVLHCLSQLLNSNCVPKQHLQTIFAISSSRLRDISGYVRKSSLQLLKSIVRYYRFLYVQSQGRQNFWSSADIEDQIGRNKEELQNIHKDFEDIDKQFQKGQISQEEVNESIKFIKKKAQEKIKIQEYLEEYQKFLEGMKTVITQVLQLCQSKNQADVIHSIKLFSYLQKYNYESANLGLRRMILLVWSQDKTIQQEVIKKFWKLFLRDTKKTRQIILQIIDLISKSNLKELISLEKIILSYETELAPNYKFPSKIFHTLWEYFGNQEIDQRSMLIFVRIMLTRNSSLLNLEKVAQIYNQLQKYSKKDPDWIIIKELATILSKLDRTHGKNQINFNKSIDLLIILLIKYQNSSDMNYFCACDSIIQLVPNAENPELIFETLLQDLGFQSTKMDLEAEEIKQMEEIHLAHAIYIAGSVSLQLLIFIDATHNSLKNLKNEREKQIGKEQEIDKIQGGIEGEFEKLHGIVDQIQDLKLIQLNLLSVFSPMVKQILSDCLNQMETEENATKQQPPIVQVSLITMCKFMCLSESYCRENIQILFNIMKSPLVDQVMKNNVIISIGDLLHRWPNSIQKFHKQIYSNLADTSAAVRRVTLLVLTHLILNDMVKSKTSLSHIPILLTDPHPQIPAMARYFLNELQKKEQRAITNAIPDIISNVQDQNENILSQISQYIDKSQIESIVDKLITILGTSTNQYEVKNISILFNHINLSQNSLQKLLDGWEEYREQLRDQFVYNQFMILIKKLKRTLPQDAKPLIEDYEMKVEHHDKETFENRRREKVTKKKNVKQGQNEGGVDKELKENKGGNKLKQQQQQQKRQTKKRKEDDFMELESDSDDMSEESLVIKKQTSTRRKRSIKKDEDE
ncbi:unnamed protein product (macronuclear) [Paramecium tetraurelia]|uniref:Condensin complex subunit 1 C-terminal domain-containing protein n=1 Tax=Paramecium tetraurelia TaxID=5888 RepID=A0DGK2_PARTE|nr:uncharacterized protein GSPATT00002298001 [Paramecium tetraurelia]CAK82169.1 unnamed protein product [Paramecium tetraurelia]|eukprot:XP_001449566.1 hypothetical protein (macronuclear) [Paramecium tetraurelia strain d4-2]